jgi:hypothetical protein
LDQTQGYWCRVFLTLRKTLLNTLKPVPICFNTLKGYQKRFNWYLLRFSKSQFPMGENRWAGSQKGYHCMWKPPILTLKTVMKALKVLIEKSEDRPTLVSTCVLVRASPAVLSIWPEKIFFASKFSYVLFCNPTHKTETGIANRWGTTNSKPRGPIIYDGPIRNTE